jgi:hypothetical protein
MDSSALCTFCSNFSPVEFLQNLLGDNKIRLLPPFFSQSYSSPQCRSEDKRYTLHFQTTRGTLHANTLYTFEPDNTVKATHNLNKMFDLNPSIQDVLYGMFVGLCVVFVSGIIYTGLSMFVPDDNYAEKYRIARFEVSKLKSHLSKAEAQRSSADAAVKEAEAKHNKAQAALEDTTSERDEAHKALKNMLDRFATERSNAVAAHKELSIMRYSFDSTVDKLSVAHATIEELKMDVKAMDEELKQVRASLEASLADRTHETVKHSQILRQVFANNATRAEDMYKMHCQLLELDDACNSWRETHIATVDVMHGHILALELEGWELREEKRVLLQKLWDSLGTQEKWTEVVAAGGVDVKGWDTTRLGFEGEGIMGWKFDREDDDKTAVPSDDDDEEDAEGKTSVWNNTGDDWFGGRKPVQREWMESEEKWEMTGDVDEGWVEGRGQGRAEVEGEFGDEFGGGFRGETKVEEDELYSAA